MAGLHSKLKFAIAMGAESSQGQTNEDSGDGQLLALQAAKVSVHFKKVVGVGSQGTVYTGRFMGEKCAVKVFNRGVIQRDVVRKYDIASIIQHHPNIVLVHGLWYDNSAIRLPSNDPALVMELCTMSLDKYLKERVDKAEVAVFRLEERLEILSGVTSGMIYLHSKKIIHGHLSAKKVLLSFSGPSNDKRIHAKVAGVCQMKLFTPDTVLRHQTSVQRSAIMPPEVKDSGEDVQLTEAVDLFSFGCLIAHVASCVYPVPNTKAGLNEFKKRAQFITESRHALVLEPLMKRCLDEHPVARGTFEDVKKDLSDYQSKYGRKQTHELEEQIDKLEIAKETLEAEVAALEKQVRALTYKLEVREEDLSKKEKYTFSLLKELEDAQNAIAEGNALEPVLRRAIEELEEEKKEQMKEMEDKVGKSRKLQRELAEAMEAMKTLEEERDQKMETIRVREGECDMLNCRIKVLESYLTESKARCEYLEEQHNEETKSCHLMEIEKDRATERAEGLQRQLEELYRDHESLRKTNRLALQEKADLRQQLQTNLTDTARERDCAKEELSVLRQEKMSLEESLNVLSQEKKRTQEKLNISESTESGLRQRIDDLQEETLKLRRELAENQRASEADRNELVAAKVQRLLAEKERDEQAEKCLLACEQRETFRNEAEEIKKQLKTLKEEHSTLQRTVSDLETDNANLQEQLSDIEDDKNKLQACLQHTEKLEVERDDYQSKFADSNEWIMHHLCTQDKEGSPKHLSEKTEFHTMMELFKVYYERASKRSEQTAEENQRLLASNDRLKEKVQELTQASQALQKELYEKQQCLDEQQREIAALTEKLSSLQNAKVVHVPLASDVVDVTADEVLLQQLCYMATGIKQLLISPDGGTFKLGSGDASLEFPPGAVVEETSARYAVILHGPFMFPAGYKPGSVIIYLNFNGTTLLKPVLLYLSHWCIKEKGEDEDTLKFVSASHTLEAEHQAYVFEEEDDADFTRTNVGVLSIRDPHCLFCVKTKREKIAMYSAIAFSRYIPSEETLLFRIQLMCDSLEWNEKLTTTLQLKNWEKTSDGDVVTRFQYADGQHQITASPQEMSGPGWEAAINGQQGVMDQMFLGPLRKSKDEVEQEVINGRFPPCILYQIIYNSPQKKRTRPALLKVNLNGADVPLVFNCRIKEEMYATSPVSPAFFSAATSSHTPDRMAASYGPSPATSGQSAERHPSSPQAEISQPADILTALDHRLDAKWRYFGTFLRVEYQVLEVIQRDKGGNPEDCMLDLLSKWTSNQAAGMGTLPRTWQTVVEAVHHCGDEALAQSLARKHGGQLPH